MRRSQEERRGPEGRHRVGGMQHCIHGAPHPHLQWPVAVDLQGSKGGRPGDRQRGQELAATLASGHREASRQGRGQGEGELQQCVTNPRREAAPGSVPGALVDHPAPLCLRLSAELWGLQKALSLRSRADPRGTSKWSV